LDQLNNYFDYLITEQHRIMEQTDSVTILNRAQGSIMALRRLKKLKDEVNSNGS